MKTCGSCGASVAADHAFCGACGARMVTAGEPPPAPPARPAPVAPAATQMMAAVAPPLARTRFRIAVVRPDGTPAGEAFLDGSVTVGTAGDIRLEGDPHVAPEHARLEVRGDVVEVTDLPGSTGIWLALSPGTPVRVRPGGRLRLGAQRFTVEAVKSDTGEGPRAWGSADRGARVRVVQHLEGGGTGAAWLLREGPRIIGRDGDALALPEDGFLSSRHGQITVGPDGQVTFEDMGSSNGSFLGLDEPTRVEAGERLLIGRHLLRVEAA
jgi:pSer/pThr/pTyr-binding forkhead associated (FHA) protein